MKAIYGLLMVMALAEGANILTIIPIPVKSHHGVVEPLLQALAARGHRLTVYSNFPKRISVDNYTDIDCSEGRPSFDNNITYSILEEAVGNAFLCANDIVETSLADCEFLFGSNKFDAIKNKEFDLVIAEMFGANCFVHIAGRLGVPLVSVATNVPLPWVPEKFGLPDNPAYIPNSLSSYTPSMSLWERTVNTVVLIYGKILFKKYSDVRSQKVAEEYFQERLPWVGDVAGNSSLLLVNSHFSLSHSRPLPPNVVEIGGIHIREAQPLPKDLQDILDNANGGVILFTFGSMLRLSSFPEEKIAMFLSVFAKLPHTVLMKYEEYLPNAPPNVITKNWLPQRDILEHKNVVALITHGGISSVMEAVQSDKPVVGVPFFSDQFLNINSLVSKSAAVRLDFSTMTEQDVEHAMNQVLSNHKIVAGMKRLSTRFRDRPQSALQSAVYWTEYVLRHKGAPHLRPVSTTLPLYQLWLLDVLAVLLAALAAVGYATYIVSRVLISCFKNTSHGHSSISKKSA